MDESFHLRCEHARKTRAIQLRNRRAACNSRAMKDAVDLSSLVLSELDECGSLIGVRDVRRIVMNLSTGLLQFTDRRLLGFTELLRAPGQNEPGVALAREIAGE